MTTTLTKPDINSSLILSKPEIALLLCCARSKIDEPTKNKIKYLIAQDIDWNFLLEIAKRHKLLPLLHYHLNNIALKFITPKVSNSFRNSFQTNIQRNLLLTSELLKILNIFKKYQIIAIPLKGPVLATYAYGNFGLRNMADLDIVVEKSQFENAKNLLLESGYQEDINNDLENKQQGSYINLTSAISVDLHYNFSPKNSAVTVETDSFFENLQSISIAGNQIHIFSTENLILYLCLEGGKEYWRTINRLCDLAELIKNQNFDWDLLIKRAKNLDKERVLFLGLFLIKEILDVSIPSNIWQLIETNLPLKLSKAQINKFLFNKDFNVLLALQWHLFNLQSFSSIKEKLKYCIQVFKVNYQVRTQKFKIIHNRKQSTVNS